MKSYLIAAATISLLVLPGCKQEQSESNIADTPTANKETQQTAVGIAEGLKAAGLSVENITEVTAENDDNNLLGRLGQYTSKAFFYDARHPKNDAEMSDPENTVEVFANDADAKACKDYIEQVTEGTPFLMQYQILQGEVLLRLDKALTPEEAKAYEAALKGT